MTKAKHNMICLMGPTACGKTALAVEIVKHFPCEIISVDSTMVYRGMNIGTAKPTDTILRKAPHRLINIRDPNEIYSAGQFRQDALREINAILTQNKIPLLVGGTMMYFRALQQGLATLPQADQGLRAELQAQAQQEGWAALHDGLRRIDPEAASRIAPQDGQRIQRALEVYKLTGKTITAWQKQDTSPLSAYHVHNLALLPTHRLQLQQRIAQRFDGMLQAGLLDEVHALYQRGDLSADLPAIRSVGYKQAWGHLAGACSYHEMREQAIIATRQLAKRQLTWLRSWPNLISIDADDDFFIERALASISSSRGLATNHYVVPRTSRGTTSGRNTQKPFWTEY